MSEAVPNCIDLLNYGAASSPDSDIAGPGVILAFLLSAYITFATVLLAYVGGQIDRKLLGPVDTYVLRVRPFNTQTYGIHGTVRQAILVLSDQQIITGVAIMGAGFNGLRQKSISVYHFQIVLYLAWMSSSVHLSALSILASFLNRRKALRAWRLCGMLTLMVLLFVGLLPTTSNDWGLLWWDGMPAGNTGWGIPAYCLWRKTWGDGVNPDAVLGVIILVVSYTWKMCALFDVCRTAFLRYVRHPIDLGLEKMLVSLAKKYEGEQHWKWLWLFRGALSIYLPITALIEVCASFSASIWLSGLGLAFGTMEIVIPRAQNRKFTGSQENSWGFGQLVPLILLVQPLGAVLEHVWVHYTGHQGPDASHQRLIARDTDPEALQDDIKIDKHSDISLLRFFRHYTPTPSSERGTSLSHLHQLLFASRFFATIVWFIHLSILGTATLILMQDAYTIGNGSAGNWQVMVLALGIFTSSAFGGTYAIVSFSRLGSRGIPSPSEFSDAQGQDPTGEDKKAES